MIENENKKNIVRVIEALIFASTKPVSAKALLPYLEEFELNDIEKSELNNTLVAVKKTVEETGL